MTRRKRNPDLNVAVCTESDAELAELTAYVTGRCWRSSGHAYRPHEWRRLIEDARQGKCDV